jgi:hypothetical protein
MQRGKTELQLRATAGPSTAPLAMKLRQAPLRMTDLLKINHLHATYMFSKVERDVIARGIFTSVKDLARKLRRYINAYSANAKPIQ